MGRPVRHARNIVTVAAILMVFVTTAYKDTTVLNVH